MGLFDLQGAESGASTAGSLGGPWAALGGGILGGLLGSEPKLPKELQKLYRMQYGLADQMRRFSQSVPLSDPGEQGALAQERGLLGQEQNQQAGDLQSQLSLNNALPGQIGDFSTNLGNQQVGQRMALDSQHLLSALSTRRQAIMQASNIAGNGAAGVRDYQQAPNFAELFGNIARLSAQSSALNKGNQGDPTHGQAQADFYGPYDGSTGQNQGLLPGGTAPGITFAPGQSGMPFPGPGDNALTQFSGSGAPGLSLGHQAPNPNARYQAPSIDPRMLFGGF